MKKWVFVTGGSKGIGKEIVLKLSINYDVYFTYNFSEQNALEIQKESRNKENTITAIHCDLEDFSSIDEVVRKLINKKKKGPYAVINNAGINIDNLLFNLDIDDWMKTFNVNIHAPFYICKLFIPSIMANKVGRIINISSVSAIKGNIGQTSYSASKAALIGFTKSLSLELARFNITVNSISPGFIDTDMVSALDEKKLGIPLKRFGYKNEVASLVDFLVNDESSYITGENIVIDGGLTT